jgi:nicotinamidase-related amidase
MRILKKDTACVVVDYQERLFPVIAENDQIAEKAAKLINGLNVLSVPMFVTEQYPKGLGETIEPVRDALGDKYIPIVKSEFSCFDNEDFLGAYENLGRKNIIIIGIESHVCVLQTAIDAADKGYNPIVIADCVSSRNLNDKKFALKRFLREGIRVSTYESILFELCRDSAAPEFKAISQIVK